MKNLLLKTVLLFSLLTFSLLVLSYCAQEDNNTIIVTVPNTPIHTSDLIGC